MKRVFINVKPIREKIESLGTQGFEKFAVASGVSIYTLKSIFNDHVPSIEIIVKIADYLGVDIEYLIVRLSDDEAPPAA